MSRGGGVGHTPRWPSWLFRAPRRHGWAFGGRPPDGDDVCYRLVALWIGAGRHRGRVGAERDLRPGAAGAGHLQRRLASRRQPSACGQPDSHRSSHTSAACAGSRRRRDRRVHSSELAVVGALAGVPSARDARAAVRRRKTSFQRARRSRLAEERFVCRNDEPVPGIVTHALPLIDSA